MALSTGGFQPGPAVLHNWFDPSLLLLERASVGRASQVKSLLWVLLYPDAFLESERSCLITRSFKSQLSPKAVLKVRCSPPHSSLLAACSMIASEIIQTRKHSLSIP